MAFLGLPVPLLSPSLAPTQGLPRQFSEHLLGSKESLIQMSSSRAVFLRVLAPFDLASAAGSADRLLFVFWGEGERAGLCARSGVLAFCYPWATDSFEGLDLCGGLLGQELQHPGDLQDLQDVQPLGGRPQHAVHKILKRREF